MSRVLPRTRNTSYNQQIMVSLTQVIFIGMFSTINTRRHQRSPTTRIIINQQRRSPPLTYTLINRLFNVNRRLNPNLQQLLSPNPVRRHLIMMRRQHQIVRQSHVNNTRRLNILVRHKPRFHLRGVTNLLVTVFGRLVRQRSLVLRHRVNNRINKRSRRHQ